MASRYNQLFLFCIVCIALVSVAAGNEIMFVLYFYLSSSFCKNVKVSSISKINDDLFIFVKTIY